MKPIFNIIVIMVIYSTLILEPPRDCIVTTGPTCRDYCLSAESGIFQWCGGCGWFLTCTSGTLTYNQCPSGLLWNDLFNACRDTSSTCTGCSTTEQPSPATTQPPASKIYYKYHITARWFYDSICLFSCDKMLKYNKPKTQRYSFAF